MIDATFVSRAQHFIPLCLLRHIADSANPDPPNEIAYIGTDGVKAIKGIVTSDIPEMPYDVRLM